MSTKSEFNVENINFSDAFVVVFYILIGLLMVK
jgi:hypothetical protein